MDVVVRGYTIHFPFQPYAPQLALMSKLLQALKTGTNALLESPTGTGKSLALLCSCLAWHEEERQRMVAEHRHKMDELVSSAQPKNEPEARETTQVDEDDDDDDDDDDFIGVQKRRRLEFDAILRQGKKRERGAPGSVDGDKGKVPELGRPPTIYIATRTHTQIAQMVKELRRTPYKPRMAVLASRNQYCVHPRVSASESAAKLNRECRSLVKSQRGCEYKNGKSRVYSHADLQQGGKNEIHDIEDLVSIGREVSGCPYFASRSMAAKASLVFCPYNYLLDPNIRSAVGIDIENAVIIFDEAHNIESTAAETASLETSLESFELVSKDLRDFCRQNLFVDEATTGKVKSFVSSMEALYAWMRSISQSGLTKCTLQKDTAIWSGEEIKGLLESFGITPESVPKMRIAYDMLLEMENDLAFSTCSRLEEMFKVFNFMTVGAWAYISDYHLVIEKTRDDKIMVNFWCLNSAVAFATLKERCHSLLLASGTLSPMDSFASELGMEFPIRLETSHVIDKSKQLLVTSVPRFDANTPMPFNWTFKKSENITLQDALGEALVRIVSVVPAGVLCFFPSYSLMGKLCRRWKQTGAWQRLASVKRLVVEPRSAQGSMDAAMGQFYAGVEHGTGALFLAVCRGKASEGIDFSDDNARAVVLVGIPFPSTRDLRIQLKKQYNNMRVKQNFLRGSAWYELQAYRAVNQAVGRCIRHKYDYGAIIFLDERFAKNDVQSSLSKWIRSAFRNYGTFTDKFAGELASFFEPARLALLAPPPAVARAVSCVRCGAQLAIVPPASPDLKSITSTMGYLCDIAQHVTGSAERILATDLWVLGADDIITEFCSPQLETSVYGVSQPATTWIPSDGLVYCTFFCRCGNPCSVKIMAAAKELSSVCAQTWFLKCSTTM